MSLNDAHYEPSAGVRFDVCNDVGLHQQNSCARCMQHIAQVVELPRLEMQKYA